MNKKEDLRVIKTKKNLYEGLLKLMKTVPFEMIKVSDICEISLTNRSTFYDHFSDKYELFASLIKDLEKELEDKLKDNNQTKNAKEYYIKLLSLLLEHILENIDIYKNVLKTNNNSIAYDMFMDTLLKDIRNRLEGFDIDQDNIPVEVTTVFYVSAVVNVCFMYIKNPKTYKKEDILTYIDELIPDNIY